MLVWGAVEQHNMAVSSLQLMEVKMFRSDETGSEGMWPISFCRKTLRFFALSIKS